MSSHKGKTAELADKVRNGGSWTVVSQGKTAELADKVRNGGSWTVVSQGENPARKCFMWRKGNWIECIMLIYEAYNNY